VDRSRSSGTRGEGSENGVAAPVARPRANAILSATI
jgi:hypothetical protein